MQESFIVNINDNNINTFDHSALLFSIKRSDASNFLSIYPENQSIDDVAQTLVYTTKGITKAKWETYTEYSKTHNIESINYALSKSYQVDNRVTALQWMNEYSPLFNHSILEATQATLLSRLVSGRRVAKNTCKQNRLVKSVNFISCKVNENKSNLDNIGILNSLNISIDLINNKLQSYNLTIELLTATNFSHWRNGTSKLIKCLILAIFEKRSHKDIQDNIDECIAKRNMDWSSNLGSVLNKILNRQTSKVNINKVVKRDDKGIVIDDPILVKESIKESMRDWHGQRDTFCQHVLKMGRGICTQR